MAIADLPTSESETKKIAHDRMLWVVRPIALVCIVVWWLHPSTTLPSAIENNILLGFLLGAAYSLFLNRHTFNLFLIRRNKRTQSRKNCLPDEYYFGKIKELLFNQETNK